MVLKNNDDAIIRVVNSKLLFILGVVTVKRIQTKQNKTKQKTKQKTNKKRKSCDLLFEYFSEIQYSKKGQNGFCLRLNKLG